MTRFIVVLIGGLIGAKIFSLIGNISNSTKYDVTNRNSMNDFWYRYNHPHLKNNSRYNNHCWNCGKKIDSYYEKKCSGCGWFICSDCGACSVKPNCEQKKYVVL